MSLDTSKLFTNKKVICLILILLMLLSLALPILSLSRKADNILSELIGSDLEYLPNQREIIKAINDSGFSKGVAKRLSKVDLSDYGSEYNLYGYEDNSGYWRIDELEYQLEEQGEMLEYYLMSGDTKGIKELLGNKDFQARVAELLTLEYIEWFYDDGLDEQVSLPEATRGLQTLLACLQDGKLSLRETYRVTRVTWKMCVVLRWLAVDAGEYDMASRMGDYTDSIHSASTACLILFLLLLAAIVLLAVFVALGKERTGMAIDIGAMVLSLVCFSASWIAAGKLNDAISTLYNEIFWEYSEIKLFSVTLWPLVTVALGVGVCVLLWIRHKDGNEVSLPAGKRSPVCGRCGKTLSEKDAFCPYCGAPVGAADTYESRPENEIIPDAGAGAAAGSGLKSTMRDTNAG